ncbi:bifunctional heptose 7-phosphate kinase/heptose 1-phosphate adenyltransferase [Fimbriimonas ginsengisoli]|uniref:ADP-heptose synthase n=1 Tax=Fimbriimonas ginsengisoli Gsoil 348 TaxID=661478 RepID=A0A068NU90_FIMGI|nr:PfkB family carbohydrate kinase [Fimbriimonas ginsengisoli]AIE87063.1 ADP-heptose synthase [Fimbriimonas ginsengisoli Gsoil 348]
MTPGELLARFRGRRALVVGDLMLDEYIFGRATRISQEAPVMVVRQSSTRAVPGGAANVASNMVAMGALVKMVGVVGSDAPGDLLSASLREYGLDGEGLVRDPSRPTTRKTRVLANHSHQVLRIDHEDEAPVSGAVENTVLERAIAAMAEVDVVLISDYQKGSVTERIIRGIVEEGGRIRVPVVANPKPKSLPFYEGAALVSLNQFEAGEAAGLGGAVPVEDAERVADELRRRLGVDQVLVTLGANGMAAAGADSFRVPAIRVEVYDEAGAGDTVIATVALGIGSGAFRRELLELAAQTAAAVVRKVGVAVPSAEDLAAIR